MEYVKLYTDILSDRKLMRAARKGAKQLALIPWLVVFAAKADDGGRLTVGGVPADPEDIADEIPNGDARAIAQCIEECLAIPVRPVLVRDPDGAVRLTAWERRAEIRPSETKEAVAARKRAERERTRAARTAALALAQQQAGDADRTADAEDTGSSSTPEDDEANDASSAPKDPVDTSREVTTGHVVTFVTGHDQSRPRCTCTGTCTCTERGTATTARGADTTSAAAGDMGQMLAAQVALTKAANAGLNERYGGQFNPLIATQGTTYKATEAILTAGVDLEFAEQCLFEAAQAVSSERPPNSLGYFREGVITAWQRHVARSEMRDPRRVRSDGALSIEHGAAIRAARQGDAAAIEYCVEHGITYAKGVA